jgi:hypothetical protein
MARPNAHQRSHRNALLKRGTINHCELNTRDQRVVPGSAWSVLYHAALRICDAYGLPGGTLVN